MQGMDSVPVFMEATEARLFIDFQKHHDMFIAMSEADVWTIGWGKATLNFADGKLQSIVREDVSWKRDTNTPPRGARSRMGA